MYEEKKKILGENIRRFRKKQGLSQRKFALMTGTSRSYLWKVEKGKADIGFEVLCRIAEALGINVRDLMTF